MNLTDPTYGRIASSVATDNIYRVTKSSFSEAMFDAAHLLSEDFLDMVARHRSALDFMIDETRDDILD